MARKTRSVKGRVYYFKRPYILHMKEDKPTVYKIQICRGRVVKEADFIAYAAGAAHVPETTMITAKHAIFEAINYFVLNGHAVQLEGLGSFSPRINSKTTQNPDEVGAELITRKYIKFNPSGDVQALCAAENISFEENKALTKQYMNQYVFRMRDGGDTFKYLVDMEGRLITHDSEALQYCDAPNATPEEAGWNWVPYDLDLREAWGIKEVTVTDHRIPNPDGEGTIVDYQIITSGEGELKMTTPPEQGGTLSPMPFAYVAPVED